MPSDLDLVRALIPELYWFDADDPIPDPPAPTGYVDFRCPEPNCQYTFRTPWLRAAPENCPFHEKPLIRAPDA